METKMIKEDRKIEVFVEREDTGSNRDLKLSLKIRNNTTSFPCLTEGELRKFKESLDEYFESKKVIITLEELRKSYDFAYYKVIRLSESDGYALLNAYISPDTIFKYERNTGFVDKIVFGEMTFEGCDKDLSEPIDSVHLSCKALIQILDTQEVEEILGKKNQ